MKRFAALLVSLLLLCSAVAFAEGEKVDLFTTENGSKVTLEMTGAYDLTFAREVPGEYVVATVSRENVEDVTVIISPYDSDITCSLADLTEEEKAGIKDEIYLEYAEFAEVTITEEVTAAGNAYFQIVAKADGIEYNERYTIFEGYNFDRIQVSFNGELTDDDRAFMEEVQAGMWVETVEVTEEVIDAGDTTVVTE